MKPAYILYISCIFFLSNIVWAAGDPAAGKQKSATCVACHGVDGNSVNPAWPKIAGQSATYTKKHLKLFKEEKRINPLMNPQAAALSEQDIDDLAAYYESMSTSPGVADEKLLEAGKSLYQGGNSKTNIAACIACHGPKGSGNPAAGFPKLSFQHAAYTAVRLKAYRAGKENYPGTEIMNNLAKNLTDEEIDAVSSYIQGLH